MANTVVTAGVCAVGRGSCDNVDNPREKFDNQSENKPKHDSDPDRGSSLATSIDHHDRDPRPGNMTELHQNEQRQMTNSESLNNEDFINHEDTNKTTVRMARSVKRGTKRSHRKRFKTAKRKQSSIPAANELFDGRVEDVHEVNTSNIRPILPIFSSGEIQAGATPSLMELRLEIPKKVKSQIDAQSMLKKTKFPGSKQCGQSDPSKDRLTNYVLAGDLGSVAYDSREENDCPKDAGDPMISDDRSENKSKPTKTKKLGFAVKRSRQSSSMFSADIGCEVEDLRNAVNRKKRDSQSEHKSKPDDSEEQHAAAKCSVSESHGALRSADSNSYEQVDYQRDEEDHQKGSDDRSENKSKLHVAVKRSILESNNNLISADSDSFEELDYQQDAEDHQKGSDGRSENRSKPNKIENSRIAVKSLKSDSILYGDSDSYEVEDLRNEVRRKKRNTQSEHKSKPDDSKEQHVAARCSVSESHGDLSSADSSSCEELDYQRDAEDHQKGSDGRSENKSEPSKIKNSRIAVERSSLKSDSLLYGDSDSYEVEDLRNEVSRKKRDSQSEHKSEPDDSKEQHVAARCSVSESHGDLSSADSCEEVDYQRDAEDYPKGSDDSSENKSKPNTTKKLHVAVKRSSLGSNSMRFSANRDTCDGLRKKCDTLVNLRNASNRKKKDALSAAIKRSSLGSDNNGFSAERYSCEEVDCQRDPGQAKGSDGRSENKSKPNTTKKLHVAVKRSSLESNNNRFSADSDSCEVDNLRNVAVRKHGGTLSEHKPKPDDSKKLRVAAKRTVPESHGNFSSGDSDTCEEIDNFREAGEHKKKLDNLAENKPNRDNAKKLHVGVKRPFPESPEKKTTVPPKTVKALNVEHESSVSSPNSQLNVEVHSTPMGLSPRHCHKNLHGSTHSKIVQEPEVGSETSSSSSLDYDYVPKSSQEKCSGSGTAPVPQYTKESVRIGVSGSNKSWTEDSSSDMESIWKSVEEESSQSRHDISSTNLHNASNTNDGCHTSVSMYGGFQARHMDTFSTNSDGQREREPLPHQMAKSPARNMNWVSHSASSSRQTQSDREANNTGTENRRQTQKASYNIDIYQSREDDDWKSYHVNWDEPTFFNNENSCGVYYHDITSFTKALNWTNKLHGMVKTTPVGILKKTPLIEKHIKSTAKEVKQFDAIGSSLTITQSTLSVIEGYICPQYWKGESCDKTCKRKHKMNCDDFPSVSPDEVFRVVSEQLMKLERPPLEMISSFIQWLTEHNETVKTLSFSKILHTKKGLNVCTTICGIFIKHLSTHFGWQPSAVVEYLLKYHYLMMKGTAHLVGVINRLIAYCQVGTYRHKVYDIVKFLLNVKGYSLPFNILDKLLHEINNNPPSDITMFKDQIRKQLKSIDECEDLNFRARAYTFLRTYFPGSYCPSKKED